MLALLQYERKIAVACNAGKWTIAPSDCRTRTSGSNLKIIITRNASHSSSTWNAFNGKQNSRRKICRICDIVYVSTARGSGLLHALPVWWLLSYQFRDENGIARQFQNLAQHVKKDPLVPMKTSKEQWEAYCNATRCHIWETILLRNHAPDDRKVRDHCYLIRRYHGQSRAFKL